MQQKTALLNKAVFSDHVQCLDSSVFDTVSLLEAFDATSGIDQLLSTGKEGVTSGTDFHLEILGSGLSLNHIATGAANFLQLVFRMNSFFHNTFLQ